MALNFLSPDAGWVRSRVAVVEKIKEKHALPSRRPVFGQSASEKDAFSISHLSSPHVNKTKK